MRALIAFAALALGGIRAPAQQGPAGAAPGPQQQPLTRDSAHLKQEIAEHRAAGETYLPDAENFTWGDRTIAAGTRVDGPVAVAHGNLDVFGTVSGDVVALGGDVRVHQSALVTGDAFAAGGRVIIDGGAVEGERRAIAITRPALPTVPATPSPPPSTLQSVKLVVAWFALLTLIGLGVMVFAEGNLDGVVIALERGFARSFWLGLAGQVVLLPGLLVLVVGLTITVIGIPAAVLVALGFSQIVFMTGCNTTVQITVPDDLRGRIMGLYALVFAGMTPIGSLMMGTIAERWGVARACAVGGTAGLLLIAGLTLAWRGRLRRAEATPPPPDGPPVP